MRKKTMRQLLLVLVVFFVLVSVYLFVEQVPQRSTIKRDFSLKMATWREQQTRAERGRSPMLAAGTGGGEEECEMCHQPYVFNEELKLKLPLNRQTVESDKLPLYRHFSGHQDWPEIQHPQDLPGQLPTTVHYVWCHEGYLAFQHYLGLLSIVRLLQPIKLVFHYHDLPPVDHDMYNSWFWELKQSIPNLVLRPLNKPADIACGSAELLRTALSLLQQDGGFLFGSNVIMSRVPRDIEKQTFWHAFSKANASDVTKGIVFASRGFPDSEKQSLLQKIVSGPSDCVSTETYDKSRKDPKQTQTQNVPVHCVYVPDSPSLFPVDVMYSNRSFAELARWLYYGKRAPMHPRRVAGQVPRMAHLIWFNYALQNPNTMEFFQFLTVLSALYVGGFPQVFIYGNKPFSGHYWEMLRDENITFVPTEDPETVFQQRVANLAHKSDILRYEILYRYGGVYHDFEAMWTQRAPDWLLSYPTVATSDWVHYGDYPDNINNGVLIARPRAPWLRHMLAAQRYYVDSNFVWNSILISYKTYERHPDQLFFFRHLQVMCDYGICHPSWEKGFQRDIKDRTPTLKFDWRTDTFLVHVTRPDPERSFVSPEALKNGRDIYAEIGRNILEKSGRMDILR